MRNVYSTHSSNFNLFLLFLTLVWLVSCKSTQSVNQSATLNNTFWSLATIKGKSLTTTPVQLGAPSI